MLLLFFVRALSVFGVFVCALYIVIWLCFVLCALCFMLCAWGFGVRALGYVFFRECELVCVCVCLCMFVGVWCLYIKLSAQAHKKTESTRAKGNAGRCM